MPSPRLGTVLLAAALVVTAGCSTASGAATSSSSASRRTVDVSVSRCGSGWRSGAAGTQHLSLHNTDSRAGEVQLVSPGNGAVYADVEPLGAGTRTAITPRLGAGRYALRCLMEDEPAVTGPLVVLRGRVGGAAPGVRPVSQADLLAATQRYQRYVEARLRPLAAEVREMVRAIEAGRVSRARALWVRSHLDFERLGAAYDAFGPLEDRINGLPDGLPRGVRAPGWTGFHRVEHGLWHGESATTLVPAARRLASDVRRLHRALQTTQIDPLTLALRAHEISENALQLQLTGRSDFGSHTELATIGAELDGTATVLRMLRPVMHGRLPSTQVVRTLRRARAVVDRLGSRPWRSLSRRQHERVDAAVSDLCEALAPVASVLEPRRTS